MGDHRATIRLYMEFHGKEYETGDWWINYSGITGECDGVDDRIIGWFRECYHDGMDRYNEEVWQSESEARKKEQERIERAELERLEAKYRKKQ